MNPSDPSREKKKEDVRPSPSSSTTSVPYGASQVASSTGNPMVMDPSMMTNQMASWAMNPAMMNQAGMNTAMMPMASWNPAMMQAAGMNPAMMVQAGMNPAMMNQAAMNPAMMEWWMAQYQSQQQMFWNQSQTQPAAVLPPKKEEPLTPPPTSSESSPPRSSSTSSSRGERRSSSSTHERPRSSSSHDDRSRSSFSSQEDRSRGSSSSREDRSRSSSSSDDRPRSSSSSYDDRRSSSSLSSRTYTSSSRDSHTDRHRDRDKDRDRDQDKDRDRSHRRENVGDRARDHDRDERKRRGELEQPEHRRGSYSSSSSSSSSSSYSSGGPRKREAKKNDEEVTGLAVRKVRAEKGSTFKLSTNHYPLKILSRIIYQYDVEFDPIIESRGTQRFLLNKHEERLGKFVFDGKQIFLQCNLGSNTVLESTSDRTQVTYTITIRKTKELTRDECPRQVYNICIRQLFRKLDLKLIGRQYFDPAPQGVASLPQHKVELWPGFFASTSPDESGITFLCDLTHKVIRTDTVLELWERLSRNNRGNRANSMKAFVKAIVGQIVLTRYNNRTYRVDRVDWERTPEDTFEKKTGERISFRDYFKSVYNKKITEMEQPLLVHETTSRDGTTREVVLLPELCCMTGLSDEMRKDFQVMKAVAEKTRHSPDTRVRKTSDFIRRLTRENATATELANWNIEFDTRMLQVDAINFDEQRIIYAREREVKVGQTGDWSRAVRDHELFQATQLRHWILLVPRNLMNKATQIENSFRQVAQGIQQHIGNPTILEVDDRGDARAYIDKLRRHLSEDTQIVVFIAPDNGKERYSEIKKFCMLESPVPVPSQCIVRRTLEKNLLSVCTKVLQQIYAKIGSILWKIKIPFETPTMIVGIDVCHDGDRTGSSIAGFCATWNPDYARYFSKIHKQRPGQELVDGLRQCMTEALRYFYKVTGKLPVRIIIYRDGLGDGQLEAAKTHELPQILEAIRDVMVKEGPDGEETKMPHVIFVVVRKRIHTRFFLDFRGHYENPKPGTLIDSGVTQKGRYEFFLVSQHVNQGTVTPTNYLVLYESENSTIKPEALQQLSYRLCHMYYNWPGTVRVPAPVAYAHKLAFLVGQSIHENPRAELCDRLHFL